MSALSGDRAVKAEQQSARSTLSLATMRSLDPPPDWFPYPRSWCENIQTVRIAAESLIGLSELPRFKAAGLSSHHSGEPRK
jgi:hypothetical protein